jgi:hypothetical protein
MWVQPETAKLHNRSSFVGSLHGHAFLLFFREIQTGIRLLPFGIAVKESPPPSLPGAGSGFVLIPAYSEADSAPILRALPGSYAPARGFRNLQPRAKDFQA